MAEFRVGAMPDLMGAPQVAHRTLLAAREDYRRASELDPLLVGAFTRWAHTFLFDPDSRQPGYRRLRTSAAAFPPIGAGVGRWCSFTPMKAIVRRPTPLDAVMSNPSARLWVVTPRPGPSAPWQRIEEQLTVARHLVGRETARCRQARRDLGDPHGGAGQRRPRICGGGSMHASRELTRDSKPR